MGEVLLFVFRISVLLAALALPVLRVFLFGTLLISVGVYSWAALARRRPLYYLIFFFFLLCSEIYTRP